MTKAMVISAHPDDAELAMGATIGRMVDSGWEVVLVDLTDGEPTPFGNKQLRKKETDKASNILGIADRLCLDMPNRYLEASLENRKKLAEVIRLHEPDLMFGPVLPDDHPDHVAAAQLIAAARFEAKLHKTDMAGEPHWAANSFEYYSTHRRQYDRPSFIMDVTDFWDRKKAAVKAYQSQLSNSMPPNVIPLLERVEITGRYFGMCIGAEYGEPFVCGSPVGLDSLSCLIRK